MRVVVAIGGNALLARGEKPDADIQLRHIETAARALAPVAEQHDLVICHGNGPQVGLLALESGADTTLSRPYPLDVLGAQTQGMIGYWLAQALRNAGVTRPVISLVTQVLVDAADPAFSAPTKFIGRGYPKPEARRLAAQNGWSVALDGKHWRRVVASPEPQRLIEERTVDGLVGRGSAVICGGGGGAPVVAAGDGRLSGVEAVVDKDLTSVVLATAVRADRLLLLTDVPGVIAHFGTPEATLLRHLDLEQLHGMHFAAGSMGPKVEACRRFVSATGGTATIGALADVAALLDGTAGTAVTATVPAGVPG